MNDQAPSRKLYILSLLVLAYTSSFLDRSIINFFVTPIKSDLGLTDTQVGLLQGYAFSICYVTSGLFVGRVADRWSRRNLIAAGLVVWCVATASCGFAAGFLVLFVGRMLVGVGESALSPSATSLITDLFSKEKLGRAMAVYAAAPYIGIGLAMFIGGWLLDSFGARGAVELPVLGRFNVWHAAFLFVGPPGLVLALLFLTFREPPRREAANTSATSEMPSLGDFARYVLANRRVYGLLFLASAMLSVVGYGLTSWLPTYYARAFSAPPSEVGNLLGISVIIGGPFGVLIGGWVGDWLRARRGDAPVLLGLIGAGGTLLLGVSVVLVNSLTASTLLVMPLYVFKLLPAATMYASIQLMTPNRMRGQIFALVLFVDAMVGMGLGPLSIGFVTDVVLGDEQRIGLSILIVVVVATIISFGCFWGIRRDDLQQTRHWQPAR